jgi:hypothetical protein
MEIRAFLRANWDRAAAVALVVLGVASVIVGWLGVRGTGIAAEQNPYIISGGVGGMVLIAIGCTMWLSADLQDEWRRLDALEEHLSAWLSMQAPGRVDEHLNDSVVTAPAAPRGPQAT